MRLLSLVTAALVLSGLYALVFEREAVRAISQGAPLSTLFSDASAEASGNNENQDDNQISATERDDTAQAEGNDGSHDGEDSPVWYPPVDERQRLGAGARRRSRVFV